VRRKVLTELMSKASGVLPDKGEGWTVHCQGRLHRPDARLGR